MPTFQALQCYKCNMMQVKQEKKSSNKWNCSICNEKQSVRKVYASSEAAKDIRKFVQDFNFSRHRAEAEALANTAEVAEEWGNLEGSGGLDSVCDVLRDVKTTNSEFSHEKRQSKWAAYLPVENNRGPLDHPLEESYLDATFVTTFPEACPKKRKGRTSSVANEMDEHDSLQDQQVSARCLPTARSYPKNKKNGCSFEALHSIDDSSLKELVRSRSTMSSPCQKENLPKPELQRRASFASSVQSGKAQRLTASYRRWPLQASEEQVSQKDFPEKHMHRTSAIESPKIAASKWSEFLNSDKEESAIGKGNAQRTSSFWSLESWETMDSAVKTEWDELVKTELPTESVDDEVHPLFL